MGGSSGGPVNQDDNIQDQESELIHKDKVEKSDKKQKQKFIPNIVSYDD